MLRLLADDLTGALDSAAPFAAQSGPIPVLWDEARVADAVGDLAFDAETRDLDAPEAQARASRLAPLLTGADSAFLKIDSRLRGHPALEIAAYTAFGGFRTTVVAPAFPAQGRVTREGRQYVHDAAGGLWEPVDLDLPAALAAAGLPARLVRRPAGAGTLLCHAETDEDLEGIAAARAELAPPVLWCGAGGLARALAGRRDRGTPAVRLRPPILVVAGSPHPATRAQLMRAAPRDGVVVHALDLAACTSPPAARAAHERLVRAAAAAPPPGTLVATGGETLLRLCEAVGALRLEAVGELAAGVPVSRLVGGGWDGVPVVSKSGGFGGPELLADLMEGINRG